jgi:hypothetical protein
MKMWDTVTDWGFADERLLINHKYVAPALTRGSTLTTSCTLIPKCMRSLEGLSDQSFEQQILFNFDDVDIVAFFFQEELAFRARVIPQTRPWTWVISVDIALSFVQHVLV